MTYEEAKNIIKTGDLFFTCENSLFSRLIRRFTQSSVSHVGIFLWENGRLLTVEMLVGQGCVMTPASVRFEKKEFFLGRLLEQKVSEEEISKRCWQSVGAIQYDLGGALKSLFWGRITKKKAFCSKFVSNVLDLEFPALERGIFPLDVANKCISLIKVTNE